MWHNTIVLASYPAPDLARSGTEPDRGRGRKILPDRGHEARSGTSLILGYPTREHGGITIFGFHCTVWERTEIPWMANSFWIHKKIVKCFFFSLTHFWKEGGVCTSWKLYTCHKSYTRPIDYVNIFVYHRCLAGRAEKKNRTPVKRSEFQTRFKQARFFFTITTVFFIWFFKKLKKKSDA